MSLCSHPTAIRVAGGTLALLPADRTALPVVAAAPQVACIAMQSSLVKLVMFQPIINVQLSPHRQPEPSKSCVGCQWV